MPTSAGPFPILIINFCAATIAPKFPHALLFQPTLSPTLHTSLRQPLPSTFPHIFRFTPTPFTTLHTSLRQPLPPTIPHSFLLKPTLSSTLHPSHRQPLPPTIPLPPTSPHSFLLKPTLSHSLTLHPSHRQPLPPIFPHTFRFSPTPFTTLHTSLRQPLPPTFPHTFRFTPTTFTTLHPSLQQALFNPTLSPVSSTSATPRPRLPCLHPHRHPRHAHYHLIGARPLPALTLSKLSHHPRQISHPRLQRRRPPPSCPML